MIVRCSDQGASADWWNNMHFQHHSKPNVIDKDPDTRIEPLFLLGDTIPIRVCIVISLQKHHYLSYSKLKQMQNTARKCPIISNIYTFLSVIKRVLI
jgi:fatty acid desaturase